jgi:lysophospholipase L1-like esterase
VRARAGAIAARLALILGGILVPLVALEIVLRSIDAPVEIYNPLNGFNVGDERLGWKGRPNVDRRFRKLAFDTRVKHSAEGFRAPEPAPDPAAAERVLVLGDSYVWGWGVSQGELFTDHLQRALGPRVAFDNRGIDAYGTAQELLLLEDQLQRHRYAKVVLLFCINDFGDNVDRKEHRPRFELRDGHPVPVNLPLAGSLKNPLEEWIDEHSRVASFIGYQAALLKARWRSRGGAPSSDAAAPALALPADDAPAATAETAPPGGAITRALLLEMGRLARAAGASFQLVFIPVPDDVQSALGLTYVVEARRELESVAKEGGFSFLDLTPSFRAETAAGAVLFIAGDGHWTPAGHELAARLLAGPPPGA